jgi:hypothetical protein
MSSKKLPETDEERIDILRTIIDLEELIESNDKVLSIVELQKLRVFSISFEGAIFVLNQAKMDRKKAEAIHDDLFKNAQMYISHFIRVLLLTVIRSEIKAENLSLYGFEDWENPLMPDLSTEDAILKWGENLMRGEAERVYRGGISLYNPTIAKVKVHYELFQDSIQSLNIYQKNEARLETTVLESREKADDLILNTWMQVEEKFAELAPDAQTTKFKAYKIQFHYHKGEQLNVFD